MREDYEMTEAEKASQAAFSAYCQDLEPVIERTLAGLRQEIRNLMQKHGEDPGPEKVPGASALLALRIEQAAYSINALARKTREREG